MSNQSVSPLVFKMRLEKKIKQYKAEYSLTYLDIAWVLIELGKEYLVKGTIGIADGK